MDIFGNINAENLEELVRFNEHYEELTSRKAMVSITGISARNLYSWKEKGLIDDDEDIAGGKNWTRINIYDYVWLKILVISRNIGISISDLLDLKKMVEFDIIKILVSLDDENLQLSEKEIISECKDEEQKTEIIKSIAIIKKYKTELQELYEEENPEYKHLMNYLGSCIKETVIYQKHINLYIIKDNLNVYFFFSTEHDAIKLADIKHLPHSVIPIYPIVMEFLGNPKNEKNLEPWGLINRTEKKLIDAIRKNDFKEITIKRNDGNSELIIEATYEQNIMHEKAKEIRQMLCMKEYNEINVKFRNDKHLIIKQKKKL
jgi:DNA-binding transcriptional MerR regulator